MNIFLTYYKNEVLKAIIWMILFLWCLTASIGFIRKKDQIIFVKMKADDVEIVKELTDHDEAYLERIFLKRFVQLHYTYDSNNFDSNLKNSSRYISSELWNGIEQKIKKQKEYLDGKLISQTAVIEKITKKDFKYEIELNLLAQKNTETFDRKFKVKVEILRTQKTMNNPFGLIVNELSEIEAPI